ncbi:MAG: hypothetical protein M2R45_05063 [Verrucomicrobia subdivision 3 bacterium]|nr:hypothetical protein [Limisphaerales bacterium]MCS1417728.1 hypothetical protein [Limisphaerales bacterium]
MNDCRKHSGQMNDIHRVRLEEVMRNLPNNQSGTQPPQVPILRL